MPASYLLAASASYNGEREKNEFNNCHSNDNYSKLPIFIKQKIQKHYEKEILKYRDNKEINVESD